VHASAQRYDLDRGRGTFMGLLVANPGPLRVAWVACAGRLRRCRFAGPERDGLGSEVDTPAGYTTDSRVWGTTRASGGPRRRDPAKGLHGGGLDPVLDDRRPG